MSDFVERMIGGASDAEDFAEGMVLLAEMTVEDKFATPQERDRAREILKIGEAELAVLWKKHSDKKPQKPNTEPITKKSRLEIGVKHPAKNKGATGLDRLSTRGSKNYTSITTIKRDGRTVQSPLKKNDRRR